MYEIRSYAQLIHARTQIFPIGWIHIGDIEILVRQGHIALLGTIKYTHTHP